MDRADDNALKRLYDSSLGRLELELGPHSLLSIWLFDEDGRVARETEDEWDHTDVPDLLQVEIGLPEPEAQSIAARFLDAAKVEGHEQPEGATRIGNTAAMVVVTAIFVTLGVGAWTIATSITVEVLAVGLLLVLLWLLPAILLLRRWDRRREKRKGA